MKLRKLINENKEDEYKITTRDEILDFQKVLKDNNFPFDTIVKEQTLTFDIDA